MGLLRQIGNRIMLVAWLRQLAYRRRLEGDHAAARRAVDEALAVVEELGTAETKALGHYLLASHLDEAESDHAGALTEFRREYDRLRAEGAAMSLDDAVALAIKEER